MFLPAKTTRTEIALPRACSLAEGDWHILSGFWHPVAWSGEVAAAPVPVRLLDERLVLWRDETGIVHAAKDLCLHRGGRLSRGKVCAGQITCPLHGFRYDGSGACRKVPALGAEVPIPKRLRLDIRASAERYGLVWVCLAESPRAPLPDWPLIEAGIGTIARVPSAVWQASAARHVENFNDLCHIPFVHPDTFGGDEDRTIAPYRVEIGAGTLSYEAEYTEQTRYKTPGAAPQGRRTRHYAYALTLPFASWLTITDAESEFHVFDIASPVSAMTTRIFQILVDRTGRLQPAEMIAFQNRINAEDAPLVEAQSPLELPLDLRDEIHIPADRMSIEYRRMLAGLGLGAETILGPTAPGD